MITHKLVHNRICYRMSSVIEIWKDEFLSFNATLSQCLRGSVLLDEGHKSKNQKIPRVCFPAETRSMVSFFHDTTNDSSAT